MQAVCIPSFSAGCPLIETVSFPLFVHSRLYSRSGCFPRASRKAPQSRLQALSRLEVVKELIVKFNRDFPRMLPFIYDRLSVFVYIQPVSCLYRARCTDHLNSLFRSLKVRDIFN